MPNLNNQVLGSAIAFIDSQVPDYQSLIAGVKPGTEVVVLDVQGCDRPNYSNLSSSYQY